jgi:NitT/TauT family transport system substrate-binding protein
MKNKKFILVILIASMLLVSCASQKNVEEAPVQPTNPPEADSPQVDETIEEVEPITIKLGLLPYSSYAPLYFAIAEGYFEEQGLNIEVVDFRTQSDAVLALASKQIDVTAGLIDVATLAATAEGANIKIVADKGILDPNAECVYNSWMAPSDLINSGELDDLNNLAGKKVVLVRAGYLEYVMDKMLQPVGLSTDDLEVMDIPAPNRVEALQSGSVDISNMGEPWITRAINSNAAEIWKSFESILPNQQLGVLWYGPTLTEGDKDAGNRFMVAYLKAVQQYNEGKTERNVALMAEFTNSSIEESQSICWQTFTSDGSVNIDSVLDFQKWANDKKYLDYTLTPEEFYDGSFLEYAQAQLP